MSRPPQYGEVWREPSDGSLWMLVVLDGDGHRGGDHGVIPLTDSTAEEMKAFEDVVWCNRKALGARVNE